MRKIIKWFLNLFSKEKIINKQKIQVKFKREKTNLPPIKVIIKNRNELVDWVSLYSKKIKKVFICENYLMFTINEKKFKYSFREQDEKYPIEFYFRSDRRMSGRKSIISSTIVNNNDWFMKSLIRALIEMLKEKKNEI